MDRIITKGFIDRLGYVDYTKAIKHVLLLGTFPICIGIFGEYGTGKSFLLQLIKKEFDNSSIENNALDGIIQWYQNEWFE